MTRPIIITCALTGGAALSGKNKAVPATPREIAESAIEAARAGAAIVHGHVRDPETGQPSMRADLYHETVQRIRDGGVDVIINLTTGPGARFVPGDDDPSVGGPGTTLKPWPEQVVHIEELRPEVCSLDVGSMNFGEHIFVNTPAQLRKMAEAIRSTGTKPELVVFGLGHIRLARRLVEDGLVTRRRCFSCVWAFPGARRRHRNRC